MTQLTAVYLCGVFNVILIVFHVLFWRIFKWKTTLEKGTKTNAIITQIMNIQLIYLFLFMALLFVFYPKTVLKNRLGDLILKGYFGFWLLRFLQQFVFLKMKGKFVISLTIIFFIGAFIHLLPLIL